MTLSDAETEPFHTLRPLLFSIAYRMLGQVMDAEDMVQEAYLRWQQIDHTQVRSPKAYLTTIVTRLCIDLSQSAQVRRETYPGPWLPEPLVATSSMEPAALLARQANQDESLSLAFMVLLESLSPVERAAFLLRDVFNYGYGEIATIIERSETTCRQITRRARQQIAARRPRFEPSPERRQQMMGHFIRACAEGDMPGLVNLLADDIGLFSDGGGQVAAALNPIAGASQVARFLLGILRKAAADQTYQTAEINGQPGVVAWLHGEPQSALTLTIDQDAIQAIYIVVNPVKLQGIRPQDDRSTLSGSPPVQR